MILFQWAVLAWSWGGLVALGAGQERSHAVWRSIFSKTMLPMQRGARSGPRGWRQLSARSAPMQRGARFFQKQCFPCSVALVLGRECGASGRPGATNQSNSQTGEHTNNKKTNNQ